MSAFTDYFKQLEIVTSQNYNSHDIMTDLTISGVTQDYFNVIDQRSDALLEFYLKETENPQLRNNLRDIVDIRDYKDKDDLMLCLLMDIVFCFESMDHPTSLNTCEGLALLNIMEKIYRPDYYMSFEDLSEVPSFIINLDSMLSYIEGCIEEVKLIKEQSLVSVLLQKINPDSDKEYRILLYRLCEAISEADGLISISEKELLMTILRLDDDDVTNDIKTDSIFSR